MKCLLDTNILSEVIRPLPHPEVMARFAQAQGIMSISAITWHELQFGVERMQEGEKRAQLKDYLAGVVAPHFPILPYDAEAARWHAAQRTRLVAMGLTPSYPDAQIAAVAATNSLVLVTRNLKDVARFSGLECENWFEAVEDLS